MTTTLRTDSNGFAIDGSRPDNITREAIAQFLYRYSGGRCVVCARMTVRGGDARKGTTFQVGHIVPGGKARKGWLAGNLATMCRRCNDRIGDRDVTPLIPSFRMREGIPAAWPTLAILRAEAVVTEGDDDADTDAFLDSIGL